MCVCIYVYIYIYTHTYSDIAVFINAHIHSTIIHVSYVCIFEYTCVLEYTSLSIYAYKFYMSMYTWVDKYV